MEYSIVKTNKFTKNYSKMLKKQNFKESEFIKVLKLLTKDEILSYKYRNHLLIPKEMRNMGVSYTK